jgi:hypothetical protein
MLDPAPRAQQTGSFGPLARPTVFRPPGQPAYAEWKLRSGRSLTSRLLLVPRQGFVLRIYEDGRCTLNWRISNRSRSVKRVGYMDAFWYFPTGLALRETSLRQGIALTDYDVAPSHNSSESAVEKACDTRIARPFDLNTAAHPDVFLWVRLSDSRAR